MTKADLRLERAWLREGPALVAGMDEVGRGALAGPVTVGVTVVQAGTRPCPAGLTDSKMLSAAARERFETLVQRWAVAHAVGHASAAEIDEVGIIGALRRAGERALARAEQMCGPVMAVLLDGSHDWLTQPAQGDLFDHPEVASTPRAVRTLVKGDLRCASVAGASVLAKCERDRIMTALAAGHERYGWDRNKGYGAPEHLDALRAHGPSEHHRRSWRLPELSSAQSPGYERMAQ